MRELKKGVLAEWSATRRGNRDWSFFGETCDDEGRPTKVWLYYAKSTPIKRHVKVKGEANPYDPTFETYFEAREGAHMLDTFRGTTLFATSGLSNVD
jgi:RNA-directed DNA polymerase